MFILQKFKLFINNFLGIDKAVAFTLAGKGWLILTGPLSLYFVTKFLTSEEQGYYYTFNSILSLQVFFELGLAFVVMQVASHEKGSLHWCKGTLEGEYKAKSRLASLLRQSLKWYFFVGIAIFVILFPVGIIFFNLSNSFQSSLVNINWFAPWFMIVLTTSLIVVTSPLFSILTGCGLVAGNALMVTASEILGVILFCICLSLNLKLFSVVAMPISRLLCRSIWILHRRILFFDLFTFLCTDSINWWTEVWTFQWKIAVSWLSGFFIYQLFNPMIFAFEGPAIAGKFGLSNSIIATFASGASAWIGTKSPLFGELTAKKLLKLLDLVFIKTTIQSTSILILGGAAFWLCIFLQPDFILDYQDRFLSPLPLAFLIGAVTLNQIVYCESLYLRAAKDDPFMPISIISGFSILVSNFTLGRYWGIDGMMFGYFLTSLIIGFGVGTLIFIKFRYNLQHEV
jgi:hypothetical protein